MAGASNAQLYELLLRIGVDADQIPEAIDRLRELGRAGDEADGGLRRGGAGATNLKSQLFDVGVQLSGGQNPLLILIQQGPQAAEAIEQMGGATEAWKWAMGGLSAFAPIIAGIAIAAAAGATAWVLYENATYDAQGTTEGAARAMNEAADSALELGTTLSEDAAKGWNTFLGQLDDAKTKLEEVRSGMSAAQIAAGKSAEAMREAAMPGLSDFEGRRQALRARIAANEAAQSGGLSTGNPLADLAARQFAPGLVSTLEGVRATNLDEALATDRAALAALDAEFDRNTALVKEGIAAAKEAADLADAEAARRKADVAERKAEADARREAALQERYQNEARREGEKWAREQTAAEKLLTESALKGTSAQNQLYAAYQARLEVLRKAAQVTGNMTTLQAAENAEGKVYLEQLQKLNEADEKRRTLTAVGGSGSGGQTSQAGFADQQAGISAAPGWVALLVELVRDLEKWGDSSAELHKQVWEGIGNLPKTLNENAGDWVKDGTKQMTQGAMDFVLGLVDNIGPIIGGVLSGLVEALIEGMHETTVQLIDWLTGKGAAEATAAKTSDGHTAKVWEGAYWENVAYDVANWFDSSNMMNDPRYENPEGYAGGTNYIPRDGTYRLHRGEEVWNRSRVSREAANPATVAGRARFTGTSIVIDIDTLSEAMSQANAKGIYFGQSAA